MKQYGEYKHVLRNRAARNLLVNHTHLCSLVPSYIPKLFVVVQFLSFIQHFATTWTAARQASLSFTISQSLLKLMYIEPVMPSNHLILCCSLLHQRSIFPSSRVFLPLCKGVSLVKAMIFPVIMYGCECLTI